MISLYFDQNLKVEASASSVRDLKKYERALLSILKRINIEPRDAQLKEDLKTIYELLSHLQLHDSLSARRMKLAKETSREPQHKITL